MDNSASRGNTHGEQLIAAGASIADILRPSTLPSFLSSLEARMLLMHALALTRAQLITQAERRLNAEEARQLAELFERRRTGEPIAYILGEREFYGLPFKVTPAVLIPRPETELLVEQAHECLPPNGKILDLGTGSGAIAVALAHCRPDARVTAADVSAEALVIARHNAARHGTHIDFLQSDWYAGLPDDRFDMIVSNPPYIVAGDAHLVEGDLRFEPLSALTDHADGLSAIRAIILGAARHLQPRGWLLLEHGYDQAIAVRALLNQQGFTQVQSWRDLAGIERVSGGLLDFCVTPDGSLTDL